MKIISVNNNLVKETVKLQQKKYRTTEFLLEGEKCILEAINSGIHIKKIFVLENYNIFSKYDNLEIIETNETILNKISTTTTAPKCVAIAEKFEHTWNKNFKNIILLEDIKDAGNLGTIIRTAKAFNFEAIILYGDTVDLYNPKCVRSTVGNLWKIPIFEINNFEILKNLLIDFDIVATLPKTNNSIFLKDYKPKDKVALMFGSEANGLSNDLKKIATTNLTIEMNPQVESLNLSVSASVIMYKIFEKTL